MRFHAARFAVRGRDDVSLAWSRCWQVRSRRRQRHRKRGSLLRPHLLRRQRHSRLRPTGCAPPHRAATAAPGPRGGYVIGPDDMLQIVFWREKDLSGEVVVRPDGRISLPLLNDVVAAGRTPDELRAALVEAASRVSSANPNATVVVKEIRSRKVFITGAWKNPDRTSLTGPTTVVQLIAMAGGLKEYADQKNIVVMRKSTASRSATPSTITAFCGARTSNRTSSWCPATRSWCVSSCMKHPAR